MNMQRCGGGWDDSRRVRGEGHEVMRGLNATNAMSPGLIQTSSALLQGQRSHTALHLCCRDQPTLGPLKAHCLELMAKQKYSVQPT